SYKSLDSDILMGTSIEMFKKHLEAIRQEGYKIVPQITEPKGEVAIMLDDGFRGIWDNRQFFYENHICPTVFLAVDLIGKKGFLTENEILELQSHGFIFQCHSWSHKDLTSFNDEELKKELTDSKSHLSNLLGKTVSAICLPIGYYSDKVISGCINAGYEDVYSSVSGPFDNLVGGYMRSRNLCQFSSPFGIKLILRGGSEIFREHDINNHYKN
ncbi:MAG: polysaccharide deacetylase family protein, partial [Prevotellaceae bacterium]|nr:polysaccharide deacetylase family protein [Prevotellaceae bacterium]